MRMSRATSILSLALCLVLGTAGAGLAASFGEVAGGVKTLTESAKDVNDISKDQKQTPQAGVSSQKSSKKASDCSKPAKSTKRAPAPKQEERVRGG
ncbi:MAG: hypothetical protein RRY29_08490 [Desulfovibrionaceae bacterium]